jgi:hypothetical protein
MKFLKLFLAYFFFTGVKAQTENVDKQSLLDTILQSAGIK